MSYAGVPAAGLAAVLRNPARVSADQPLSIETRAWPLPGPSQVRLAVRACGVCRTDLQLCEGDLATHRLPVVPGHQIVGIIDAVGSGVDPSLVGERRGVAWIADACGRCRSCEAGRENLCEHALFTGWDLDGGFATHAVAQLAFTYPLPPCFSDTAAASMLCAGTIGFRCLKVAECGACDRVGLFGFGASARFVCQLALSRGCDVFVVTRTPSERKAALAFGATWAGVYGESPPVQLDSAITFAPVGSAVIEALGSVRRGGIVAVNAIHLDEIPAFPYELLWWERQLRSVANVTRADVRDFLAEAATTSLRTEVTTYPFPQANRALADLAGGRARGSLVLEFVA
ncbi:MAG: zinc-binding alcohol dehydrogenase family protein [Acidimicrobiales bacterium]